MADKRSRRFAAKAGWTCRDDAWIRLEMARAAMRIGARNEAGRAMVIEHLKRAIEAMEGTSNAPLQRRADGNLSTTEPTP